ncbi:hypothetical protein HDV63DRAFT_363182 [Trichoderma sp. SZMC 28014]
MFCASKHPRNDSAIPELSWEESRYTPLFAAITDAKSAQTSSDIVQKRRVSVEAAEGDGLSAPKRPKLVKDDASSSSAKTQEPGCRDISTKRNFYSQTATKIREKGFPPSPQQSINHGCQTEIQELRQAINKMNDALGRLTQTLDQVVKKLDTVAQNARIHRKGTQRLIAAANGEETPANSEDEGA